MSSRGRMWGTGAVVAACAIASASAAIGPEARAQTPSMNASTRAAPAADTGMTLAELEKVLEPLGDSAIDVRRAAAKRASELPPDALGAITQKLTELRKGNGGAVSTLVRALRDQNGGKAPPDMVEALVTQAKGDAAVVRATLVETCLARSLARIGTTPAVRQIVAVASDANGAFRPELTRLCTQLGERSVAALIEAKKDTPNDTRVWAGNVLDALNKRLPGDAVQTKDNQLLADVLHAYGAVKDLDAVPVILSFVNSDRAQVRAAAREALEAYGNDAIWKLKEAYTQLTGKPANDGWTAPQIAKELFEAHDRYRLQEVYAMLDDGLAKQKAGQLDAAVGAFDKVLARQPMLDRRPEMVAGYVAWAETLEDHDRPGALAYLRKAQRIDEAGPHAQQIQSEILYLEGEDLLARGIADADTFRRAVALDPGNTRAQAELARLETVSEDKQSNVKRWIAAGAVFALAVVGIILFGGRRKRDAKNARA